MSPVPTRPCSHQAEGIRLWSGVSLPLGIRLLRPWTVGTPTSLPSCPPPPCPDWAGLKLFWAPDLDT